MSDIEQIEQQAGRLAREANTVLTVAQDFKITTPAEYEASTDEIRQIKARQKELQSRKDSVIKPINEALRKARELFKPAETALAEAETVVKHEIARYSAEEEKKRRQEHARLEEQARKEREKKLEQARTAEVAGKSERAAVFLEQAATTVSPVAKAAVPKAEGVSFVERWKFEVKDPSRVPRQYLMVDEKKIGQVVRALKGDANIPGVRVYAVRDVSARSAVR